MRLGQGGEHRLAVNGHLGVLGDDVRPPRVVQNDLPTAGIEYVCQDGHAIGILMLLANSGTRGGTYEAQCSWPKEIPDTRQ